MTHEVNHNKADRRFEIELNEKLSAYVSYRYLDNEKQVDFLSTFVPESHRGQGLAALVVDAALNWAEEMQLSIQASCWYVDKRLRSRREAS